MELIMGTLEGKVALVTGGSRGIGAAIVQRLAAAGADVALTYTRSADKAEAVAQAVRKGGRKAIAIAAEAADPKAAAAAVNQTVRELKRLDILVNNAGIFRAGPLEEVTLEDFDATMEINVRAVFFSVQAAAAHMKSGGRIISIGSNLAEQVFGPGMTVYSASKAALIGMTRGLARDLGPRGITVNVVQPGPINTDMNPADGPHSGPQLARLAIGHYGEPRDIAGLVTWLASDEGRFITGTSITIDGGGNA
jgi:NAD(P)-dependent dehydrogenase (short-subunit alcohol dehydrogenase family)